MFKVYHFDINGTILGTDSTDNVPVESIASEAFARSINLVGEVYEAGEQTYYSHIKHTNKEYKKVIYNFINDFPQHQDKYTKLVNVFQNGLFPSFLKLVNLEFKNNQSLLVLRTFGKDREWVARLLETRQLQFVVHISDELNLQLYKECLNKGVHIMVQDDYHRWNSNGKKVEFGKDIKYIDGITQYGFDDNVCMNCDVGVKFHHVNTLQAALDEHYYVNLVDKL